MMKTKLSKTEFLITNWNILSNFEKSDQLRKIASYKSYNKIKKK